MRTLDSEELKLVYGGTDSGGCKPTTKPSCSNSKSRSKASCSKSKSKSHHDHGKHLGWCHKKD
jgi:hypothetical protein